MTSNDEFAGPIETSYTDLEASFRRVLRERDAARTALAASTESEKRLVKERDKLQAKLDRPHAVEHREPCGDQVGRLVCTRLKGHGTHWNGSTAWQPHEDHIEAMARLVEAVEIWADQAEDFKANHGALIAAVSAYREATQ